MQDMLSPLKPNAAMPMKDRKIVLGVTGSIAAYKAADLCSRLVRAGAQVDVILTENATRFVGAATFAALTQRQVITGLYENNSQLNIDHVEFASKTDVIVIAPATANTIARLALGLADDVLTATVLASDAPVIVAPAMDGNMYKSDGLVSNITTLSERGVQMVGPELGRLASGMTGKGRMTEPRHLMGHIMARLGNKGDYLGQKVIVTAGGTEEAIDPVRVITNRSSGKMGYALAEAARDRGAVVTLVTAPTSLEDPSGIRTIHVRTANDMEKEVLSCAPEGDLLIMAAAIADFRPSKKAAGKIKKRSTGFALNLIPVEDWLHNVVGQRLLKVVFAAETTNLVENARKKLETKSADIVVANDVTEIGAGFGTDTNKVTILDSKGHVDQVPLMEKYAVAQRILDCALPFLRSRV